MAETDDKLLWMGLNEISKETAELLGDRAHCFIELYNDWLDIFCSLAKVYSKDLQLTSLVAADFLSLGKNLHWLHRLLHWGNYPLVMRGLRYDWELMFRAYFADVYQPSIPGDADIPGNSVDDKIQWLESRGRDLHMNSLIVPIMKVLLPKRDQEVYKQLWRELNKHVHPTKALRYRMIEESGLALRDGFDQEWAGLTIKLACDVYDLIWLLTLYRFPEILPLLTDPRLFKHTPRTYQLLRELSRI